MNDEQLKQIFDNELKEEEKVVAGLFLAPNCHKKMWFRWFVIGYRLASKVK